MRIGVMGETQGQETQGQVPVSKLAEVLKIHIYQMLRQSRQRPGTALYHIIMHGIVADKREEECNE